MHAIVLAGQPNQGLLKATYPTPFEAEIPIGGRPMAWWVLDALFDAPSITSVGLVGPASLERPGVTVTLAGEDLFSNVLRGLHTAPQDADTVLFVTSDIPWLTKEVVEAFIDRAPAGVDVVYPIIPKEVAKSRFPSTKRTYVRLKEGVFTGGNLFLARAEVIPRLKERADVLLRHRKSPWALARDIGPGLLLRLVLGRLSIRQAEVRVGGLLGISGRALIFPFAEAGVDIDKEEDLVMAERELNFDISEQGWDIS